MPWLYRIGYIVSNLVAKLYFRLRVIHQEKLAVEGGHLIVANHTSFLDPPIMGSTFPRAIYYLARKSLFKEGLVAWIYHRIQAIPVDQSRPEYSVMKKIIRLVQEGENVLIFPEGERTGDGKLKEKGQPGIGLLIAKSRVPILPVRLFGAFEALPRGAKFPRFTKMTLVAGDPIDLNDFIDNSGLVKKELYQALSDKAMDAIAALELPGGQRGLRLAVAGLDWQTNRIPVGFAAEIGVSRENILVFRPIMGKNFPSCAAKHAILLAMKALISENILS